MMDKIDNSESARTTWLSSDQAAERLGLSIGAVRKLFDDGEFPGGYRLPTGKRLMPLSDVDAFIARNRAPCAPIPPASRDAEHAAAGSPASAGAGVPAA